MSFQFIGSGADLNGITSQMNANILELKNQESTKVIKDDTGTRRVLFGKGADGFYGMKVSQEGIDVYDAEDDELIFNSSQNVFKIVETDTFEYNSTADSFTTKTIPHNLGYTPIAMVYFNDNSFSRPLPTAFVRTLDTVNNQIKIEEDFSFEVDDTNLYIIAGNAKGTDGTTKTFKYYLLRESAA